MGKDIVEIISDSRILATYLRQAKTSKNRVENACGFFYEDKLNPVRRKDLNLLEKTFNDQVIILRKLYVDFAPGKVQKKVEAFEEQKWGIIALALCLDAHKTNHPFFLINPGRLPRPLTSITFPFSEAISTAEEKQVIPVTDYVLFDFTVGLAKKEEIITKAPDPRVFLTPPEMVLSTQLNPGVFSQYPLFDPNSELFHVMHGQQSSLVRSREEESECCYYATGIRVSVEFLTITPPVPEKKYRKKYTKRG